MDTKEPLVQHRDETEPFDCPFGHVQRIVTGGEGGVANVHVVKITKGAPHVHTGYDEVYYVLSEIAFGHELAKAWPGETIGIIKFAIGGTSLLAWKPDWSKEDADRVGQGRLGSLYKRLMDKVDAAQHSRDIEIVGFLWLQGLQVGGDMQKVNVAKEYLDNLKSLVAAVRQGTGVADLPLLYGSPRLGKVPDDLSDLVPKLMDGRLPAAQWVLKAQFDAQKTIPNSKMVILRDIERHPADVFHYNTAGQLAVGKLFAQAVLKPSPDKPE